MVFILYGSVDITVAFFFNYMNRNVLRNFPVKNGKTWVHSPTLWTFFTVCYFQNINVGILFNGKQNC